MVFPGRPKSIFINSVLHWLSWQLVRGSMEKTCRTCCRWPDHAMGMLLAVGSNRWYPMVDRIVRLICYANFGLSVQSGGGSNLAGFRTVGFCRRRGGRQPGASANTLTCRDERS